MTGAGDCLDCLGGDLWQAAVGVWEAERRAFVVSSVHREACRVDSSVSVYTHCVSYEGGQEKLADERADVVQSQAAAEAAREDLERVVAEREELRAATSKQRAEAMSEASKAAQALQLLAKRDASIQQLETELVKVSCVACEKVCAAQALC
jgi:hypothetical protein